MEFVVLVNEQDEAIGLCEKLEAHKKGLLHRAFSVFVFNHNNELLLQQRALSKYHSGGLWTNTCCSHPREHESIEDAAKRRCVEEMGIDVNPQTVFSFVYKSEFENGLIEHEYDYVLTASYNENPNINLNEVAHFKWLSLDNISKDIQDNPNSYTTWFRLCFEKVKQHITTI
jgi:isopentenyl-diphosphate delta-isomerase